MTTNSLPHKVRLELLFDFYRSLLTEKQQRALELHWDEDLSLGEVAEHLNVSRQAVYYAVKSAQSALERYEEKLGLVAQFEYQRKQAAELLGRLDALQQRIEQAEVRRELGEICVFLRTVLDG